MLERQKALAATERRQQWRTMLDARMKIPSESDDDDDESNGELVGSAEYGPDGDHEFEPEAEDEDEDNDNDVFSAPREYKQRGQYGLQEYGHSGGAPDASGLRAPQDDRERARIERDRRGDQAWRTAGQMLTSGNLRDGVANDRSHQRHMRR
jgi:hypothetical protein